VAPCRPCLALKLELRTNLCRLTTLAMDGETVYGSSFEIGDDWGSDPFFTSVRLEKPEPHTVAGNSPRGG
jgi:hypothetical protein